MVNCYPSFKQETQIINWKTLEAKWLTVLNIIFWDRRRNNCKINLEFLNKKFIDRYIGVSNPIESGTDREKKKEKEGYMGVG